MLHQLSCRGLNTLRGTAPTKTAAFQKDTIYCASRCLSSRGIPVDFYGTYSLKLHIKQNRPLKRCARKLKSTRYAVSTSLLFLDAFIFVSDLSRHFFPSY